MKNLFFFCFSLLWLPLFAQNSALHAPIKNPEHVECGLKSFVKPEALPVFPTCEEVENNAECFEKKLKEHFKKHLYYTQLDYELGIENTIDASFVIDSTGIVRKSNIEKKGSKNQNKEVLRVISLLPKMKPATINGKAIETKLIVSVYFKILKGPVIKSQKIVTCVFKPIPEPKPTEFSGVDTYPIFSGCEENLAKDQDLSCFKQRIKEHIKRHLTYPKNARKKGVSEEIVVSFIIGTNGKIKKAKAQGANKSLKREAKRLVKSLPKMKPATQKGKPVAVPYTIPIYFKLKNK